MTQEAYEDCDEDEYYYNYFDDDNDCDGDIGRYGR